MSQFTIFFYSHLHKWTTVSCTHYYKMISDVWIFFGLTVNDVQSPQEVPSGTQMCRPSSGQEAELLVSLTHLVLKAVWAWWVARIHMNVLYSLACLIYFAWGFVFVDTSELGWQWLDEQSLPVSSVWAGGHQLHWGCQHERSHAKGRWSWRGW